MQHADNSMRRISALLLALLLIGCASQPLTQQEEASLSAYVDLAISYISQGNLDGARNALQQAETIDDNDARVHHTYGLLYQTTRDYQEAENAFKEALAVDPDFSQARNNYGVFLGRRNRYEEAIVQLQQAASDIQYDQRALAYENMTEVSIQADNLALAVESIQSAIAQEPNEQRYYLRAAHLLYLYQDYDRGAEYFNIYLQLIDNQGVEPTRDALQVGLALAEARNDEPTKEYFQQRMDLLPQINVN